MLKLQQLTRRFRSKKSFFYSTIVLVVLLLALPLGLYLVLNKTNFFPRAAEKKNVTSRSKPDYVPGEVIVKFKQTNTGSYFKVSANAKSQGVAFEKQAVDVSSIEPSSLPPSLKRASSKFRIKSVEKVFKNYTDPQTELNKFKRAYAADLSQGKRKINEQALLKFDFSSVYKIKFDDSGMPKEFFQEFIWEFMSRRGGDIEWAEPNYIYKLAWIPNDPFYLDSYPNNISKRDPTWSPTYDYQWDLKKIKMTEAWDVIKKGSPVKVAVLDTGVDYTHPEFGGCTLSQVKDDQCPRITPGYNFVENNDDPQDLDVGHGTHVAGTIAALTNNGIGMAGMDRFGDFRIMPIRGLGLSGGSVDSLAQGLRFAADNGAQVVNNSWGGEGESTLITEAIQYGTNHGVVFVAAAGNSAQDMSDFFPANIEGVIAVGATDVDDKLTDYSNYGDRLDVVAPGGKGSYDLLSLAGTNLLSDFKSLVVAQKYLRLAGTSMAAPHVTGLAAIIRSQKSSLNPQEVRNIIVNSADDLGNPGFDSTFGYGRINVLRAVTEMNTTEPTTAVISSPSNMLVGRKFEVLGTVSGNNFKNYQLAYNYDANCLNGKGTYSSDGVSIPDSNKPVRSSVLASVNLPTSLPDGQYCFKLTVNTAISMSVTHVIYSDKAVVEGWPKDKGPMSLNQSQIVVDINSDGRKEILYSSFTDGFLHAYTKSGHEITGFPIPLSFPYVYSDWFPSTADKRGFYMNVLKYPREGQMILGWGGDGKPLPHWSESDWNDQYINYLTVPSIGDLYLNGKKEIVAGELSPISDKTPLKIYAFDADRNPLPGWSGGVDLPDTLDPQQGSKYSGLLFTLIGNVGGPDSKPEVVALYRSGDKGLTTRIAVFDNKGILLSKWVSPNREEMDNAILGDVDGNGKLEIVTTAYLRDKNNPMTGYDRGVTAWKGDGTKLWTYVLDPNSTDYITDISLFDTGDGLVKVYACMFSSGCFALDKKGQPINGLSSDKKFTRVYFSSIVKLKNQNILFLQAGLLPPDKRMLMATEYNPNTGTTSIPSGYPKVILLHAGDFGGFGTPLPADLDGDGKLELVIIAMKHPFKPTVVYVLNTDFEYDKILWSQYQGNEGHTGAYESAVSPTPTPTPTITPTPSVTPTPTPTPSGCTASCVSAVTTGSCKQGSPCKTSDQKSDSLPKVTFTVNSSGCTNGVTVDLSLGQFSATDPVNQVPWGTWWNAANINQTGSASADWNFCNNSVCHSFNAGQTLYWRVRDSATGQSKAICSPFNAPSISSASIQQPNLGFFPALSNVLGASTTANFWESLIGLVRSLIPR